MDGYDSYWEEERIKIEKDIEKDDELYKLREENKKLKEEIENMRKKGI